MSHFIEDMRRLVSFVNWHLTLLLEHSVQLDVSVASHCRHVSLKLSVPRALALETHFDFSFATRVATGILAALTVCALVGRQHSSGVVSWRHAGCTHVRIVHHHPLRHSTRSGRIGIRWHRVSRGVRCWRKRRLHRHLRRWTSRYSRMVRSGRARVRRTRHGVAHRRRLYRTIVVRNSWWSSVANILRLWRIVIGLLAERSSTIISHDGLGCEMLFLVVHQTRWPVTKKSGVF